MLVQSRRCQRLKISYVLPSVKNFAIPPFALGLIRNLRVNLWIFSNADQRTIRKDFAYLAVAWKHRDDINRFEIDIAWRPLISISFKTIKEHLEPLEVLRNIKTVALSPVIPQPVSENESTYCENFKKLLEKRESKHHEEPTHHKKRCNGRTARTGTVRFQNRQNNQNWSAFLTTPALATDFSY